MSGMAERPPLALAVAAAVALAAPLAGCYGPSAPYGAPCLKETDCPSKQSCNPQTNTCGPPSEAQVLRHDTADDFGAPGAYTDEVAIEPGGFIGPAPYFSSGLRLSGIDSYAVTMATKWDDLAALPRTGTTFQRKAELGFGSGAPLGTGLTKADDITVLVEGEVYLDKIGPWTFELLASDAGFVELAPPGSSTFQRVVFDSNNKSQGTYMVTAAGWHRLRGAVADASGEMTFDLRYNAPAAPGNPRPIEPRDLRAPGGGVAGLIADGFEDPYLMGPVDLVFVPGTLGNLTLLDNPFGLVIGNNSYSVRFTGQVLIDVGGAYELKLVTGQGHRMWLDGLSIADRFDANPQTSRTGMLTLEPGWHDLVVDLNRSSAPSATLDLQVLSGPAWAGGTIPLDHLRPVVARGSNSTSAYVPGDTSIADMGAASRLVSVPLRGDFVTSQVDAVFSFSHSDKSTMQVRIVSPSGASSTKVGFGQLSGSGAHFQRTTMPAFTGSNWSFVFTDNLADLKTGTITYAAVSLLGSAGTAPFAKSYRYISAPQELGVVVSFSPVKWALRQATPDTQVNVLLRTCDTPEACTAEPWTPVAEDATPEVRPRRFAQYQVEVIGDGDVPTALDWIEFGYRAIGEP